jgi:apolipoprotein N-acyltransferase
VFALIAGSSTRREALTRSWLAGAAFLTALHHWLVPHMGLFTLPVAAFVGLFWLPLGLAVWSFLRRGIGHRRRWAGLAVVPSVWVLLEWVRSWEHLGGTWGLWGLTQWQVGPIIQAAALGGVWLLSFLTVTVNVALASTLPSNTERSDRMIALGVAAAIPLVMVGAGALRDGPPVTGTVSIAGIQPGVFHSAEARLSAHIELTESLDPATFDLVVWGQSSVGFDLSRNPGVDQALRSLSATVGADVLVNVDAESDLGITKSTVQYTPAGPVATYEKRRLVPFGEYVPLRRIFGWIDEITEAAEEDRIRGTAATTLTSAGIEIGPLISYESTFPDMRRQAARNGADLTVVQGSTSTFQGTWAQPQQASYEAVRAVESGRPAVLIAMSGVSTAFDATGGRLAWVPADVRDAFVVEIPLSREDTPYVRFGDWVIWLSAATTAGAVTEAALRWLPNRRSGRSKRSIGRRRADR